MLKLSEFVNWSKEDIFKIVNNGEMRKFTPRKSQIYLERTEQPFAIFVIAFGSSKSKQPEFR
jgi:hypothetical protein